MHFVLSFLSCDLCFLRFASSFVFSHSYFFGYCFIPAFSYGHENMLVCLWVCACKYLQHRSYYAHPINFYAGTINISFPLIFLSFDYIRLHKYLKRIPQSFCSIPNLTRILFKIRLQHRKDESGWMSMWLIVKKVTIVQTLLNGLDLSFSVGKVSLFAVNY